jgi:hypothetical protein
MQLIEGYMSVKGAAGKGLGTPDALMVPEKMKQGRRQIERINSILDIGEPLLGIDRSLGERAYVRRQGDGWLFVTKDPQDTIYFPLRSPLQGRPRYDWIDCENGIRAGYLTTEATRGA